MSETANYSGNEPWISLESASWWFDKSSVVLAISLFIGFVCTVIIIVMGIAKEHHWELARERADKEIGKLFKDGEQLQKDAEQLRKDTAEAKAHAAASELELERLRMPRFPNTERFKNALVGITPPTTVEILYVEACSDCWMLADMIGGLFTESKWPSSVRPIKQLPNPPDWMVALPPTLQHRANPVGLSVVTRGAVNFDDKKSTPVAVTLALAQSVGPPIQVQPDPDLPDGVIKVVIAPKM